MINSVIESILNSPIQPSAQNIFLAFLIVVFYYLRKDAAMHLKETKETTQQMFRVIEKNTEAQVRLAESINELKSEIRRHST